MLSGESGTVMHKHIQMVVKGNFNTLPVLNKKIKICLGWDVSPPMGHVVFCKKLRYEVCMLSKAWLVIVRRAMGRSILSLFIIMF